MPQKVEIALAFPRTFHQATSIQGILQYEQEHDLRWSYVTAPESLHLSILNLRDWNGDAVIAALNTLEEADFAAHFSLPVVNISSSLEESPVPRVSVDNVRIGELAADHLLSRSFHSFAYFGLHGVAYSSLRLEGYAGKLADEGATCEVHLAEPTYRLQDFGWQQQHRDLAAWLTALPKPVAVFAVTDYRAQQVIEACHRLEMRVPHEISVLGVDDEDFVCRNTRPRLSSIARNNALAGYRTAAMLDQLLKQQQTPDVEFVPPAGIVARESTNVIVVSDARVRMALDYVSENLSTDLDVNQIARHVNVSRRWLEYAFRESVGDSPYQYIRKRRLERAGLLLRADRKSKIADIARRTGFRSAKQLAHSFQQWSGMSPREYRRSGQDSLVE